jgi:hypothetical protein
MFVEKNFGQNKILAIFSIFELTQNKCVQPFLAGYGLALAEIFLFWFGY